jgi:hypothetical protein
LVLGFFSRRDLRFFVLSGSGVLPCMDYSIKVLVPCVIMHNTSGLIFWNCFLIPNKLPKKSSDFGAKSFLVNALM